MATKIEISFTSARNDKKEILKSLIQQLESIEDEDIYTAYSDELQWPSHNFEDYTIVKIRDYKPFDSIQFVQSSAKDLIDKQD